MTDIKNYLSSNEYPGRGIAAGLTEDKKSAFLAYFIMGRSVNSRNRIFVKDGETVRTKAFDESKMKDPSLIIYAPVRVFNNTVIVTNGDQTDTVYDFLSAGKSFEEALRTRRFEPDEPNYTPRISCAAQIKDGALTYKMSIIKSAYADGLSCDHFFYEYSQPQSGKAHIIHTYECNGNPIPSFKGEPVEFAVPGSTASECGDVIWNSLNSDNKVSLLVRFVPLSGEKATTIIYNKNI
ncbi:MAG TPA: IMP cyclohydrolase [Bacillota bacterium]|nr:IMP cyclohydrolase [Bacillota bacterium]